MFTNVEFSVKELVRVPSILYSLGNLRDLLDYIVFSIQFQISLLNLCPKIFSFLKEGLKIEV